MILIIDDAPDSRLLTRRILESAGYTDIRGVGSAREAFRVLGIDGRGPSEAPVELILMDLVMPDVDGIQACHALQSHQHLEDIPILMLTARPEREDLQSAFDAGAWDYIRKPIDRPVFLARIRNAMRLKEEIESRKARERELEETKELLEDANRSLKAQALSDGLTGIANRRHFEEFLTSEWSRAARETEPISLILLDIDYFKKYNDAYQHQAGDECLRRIATTLREAVYRPGDLVARYGGEEMVVVLTRTDEIGALEVAERLREAVIAEHIPHRDSPVSPVVTISLGVATLRPSLGGTPERLIAEADAALYRAKRAGRNRTCTAWGEMSSLCAAAGVGTDD